MHSPHVYRPGEGLFLRRITALAVALLAAAAAARLTMAMPTMPQFDLLARAIVFATLSFAGAWGAFRLVNMPLFTDYLVAADSELKDTWWPHGRGLLRAAALAILALLLPEGFVVAVDYLTTLFY